MPSSTYVQYPSEAEMEEGPAFLRNVSMSIGNRLDSLKTLMGQLEPSWQGAAAVEFQDMQRTHTRAMQAYAGTSTDAGMDSLLQQLARAVEQANDNARSANSSILNNIRRH